MTNVFSNFVLNLPFDCIDGIYPSGFDSKPMTKVYVSLFVIHCTMNDVQFSKWFFRLQLKFTVWREKARAIANDIWWVGGLLRGRGHAILSKDILWTRVFFNEWVPLALPSTCTVRQRSVPRSMDNDWADPFAVLRVTTVSPVHNAILMAQPSYKAPAKHLITFNSFSTFLSRSLVTQ